ncbi:MAG: type I restriction enzyme HsdR N-terminal domain-containing protein [Candidatus Symbiobacter sp.]|nr:type I restriction enzyme HsdR N-terminal domain-containing protein [Candidatus Symbiobacter sp.]
MDIAVFDETIKKLSRKISERQNDNEYKLETEEATKSALVVPFIRALGYDDTDPKDVIPEYDADIKGKKGEKVDYILRKNGQNILLIECKKISTDLAKDHKAQLKRYFEQTGCKFGLLTNGIDYHFFTELDKPNVMDEEPFFTFSLPQIKPKQIEALRQFAKESFDGDKIRDEATVLKYSSKFFAYISQQLKEPTEEFTKFVIKQNYEGSLTAKVSTNFGQLVKQAVVETIDARIQEVLDKAKGDVAQKSTIEKTVESESNAKSDSAGIVTTEEEIEGFNIVRAILRQYFPAEKIVMRDMKSCCLVLFEDSVRKPIARMYFNDLAHLSLGLINQDKTEDKFPIASVDEIFKHADRLIATAKSYESVAVPA